MSAGIDPPHRRVTAGEAAVGAPWGYAELLVLAAIGVLCQMAVVGGTAALVGGLGPARELLENARFAIPMQTLAWIPVLAYVAFVVRVRWSLPLNAGLAWLPMRGHPLRYARLGLLLACGSALASIVVGGPDQGSPMEGLLSAPGDLWLVAAFGVLFAPCVEEVVFRGFLYGPLERLHGGAVAVAGTTALFTVLHGAQYAWSAPRLAILAAVGLALGAVRHHSGSTVASTLVHVAYNAALFAIVGIARLGVG